MREMKDSGVAWIGEIPAQWDIKTIRNLLIERNEKNRELSEKTILSLSAKSGVTLYSSENHSGNKPREDLSDYKIVRENDIVVNSMNILSGSVGLSKYTGVVSPVYYIYYPREKNDVQYLHFIFQCFEFQRSLWGLGNGILIKETESGSLNTIRMRIPSKKLSLQEFPSPPIDEQQKIAAYLDCKCTQIDALIINAQEQIEKLKSYKQSIITETVTKGINPDVEMKDSGVEWIGEIPVHWSIIRKLSYVTTEGISYGIVKLYDPDDENGVKVLRCSDVLEGYICTDNIRTVTKEVSQEYSRTILSGGEVLVNVRGSLGGCSIVPNDMAGYNIAREVAKISPDVSINNKYLMYYLLSHCFVDYRTRHLAGSVYIGLNIELLSSCPIPFPELFEQQQITDYLDRKCSQIDKLIALKHQKTEKLQQYKKSLIYEYVTGKKEV